MRIQYCQVPRGEGRVWWGLGVNPKFLRGEYLTSDPRRDIASKGRHVSLITNMPFTNNCLGKSKFPADTE